MNQLEQALFDANKRLYREAKSPLRSHGPDHHLRVYEYAKQLAGKLGVKYDAEVLAGAAMLHDLAAYYPERTGKDYHDWDDKLAGEALREIKQFPAGKIEAAVNCIAHHGSDPKFKDQDEAVEITLLRDADKLDAFGPVGMARIVMVRTLNGDTLEDIIADFWTGGHLQRKWDSITTDEAREMGRSDYDYSKDFLARLAEGLKLE